MIRTRNGMAKEPPTDKRNQSMAAQSIFDQLRKLDEQRHALIEGAKKEAMEKVEAALHDLNSLGYHYRLVEGTVRKAASPSGVSRKGAGQLNPDRVCPICEFKTEPAHDARRHRGQKVKQPFTTAELEMLHLKRVE